MSWFYFSIPYVSVDRAAAAPVALIWAVVFVNFLRLFSSAITDHKTDVDFVIFSSGFRSAAWVGRSFVFMITWKFILSISPYGVASSELNPMICVGFGDHWKH